jgi:hypothetical protein
VKANCSKCNSEVRRICLLEGSMAGMKGDKCKEYRPTSKKGGGQ